MASMKMKESKFGAPAGVYTGKFLGVQPMKSDGRPRLGRDGKPMEPGIEWQWEIQGGEQHGQIVGRITSEVPTTKNACGALLGGLVGRTLRPEEDVDPDQYVGQLFQVVIAPSKENPERTQVTQVFRQGGSPPAASAPTPPRAPSPPPAAPQPPAPPAPQPQRAREPHYWMNDGSQSLLWSGSQIRQLLATTPGLTLQLMAEDQQGGWHGPEHFGLADKGMVPPVPPQPPQAPQPGDAAEQVPW